MLKCELGEWDGKNKRNHLNKQNDQDNEIHVYDSVFWTMINNLKSYVPALVNEAFGEQYTDKTIVTLKAGKQVTDRPSEGLTRRDADAVINLWEENRKGDYHFECEADGRSTVAKRIVQYGAGYAAQDVPLIENGAVMRVPHSAVIFLRSSSTDIKDLTIRVEHPGYVGSYKVPVLRMSDYTVDELFEKKLLVLVPFAGFKFSDKDYARMNETNVQDLKELVDDIGGRLNAMVEANEIEPWVRGNIIRYMRKVLEHLTQKYEQVNKEVKNIMGGYIIKTDIDEAMEKAAKEATKKTEEQVSVSYIENVMNSLKCTARQAMEIMGVSPEKQKHYTHLLKNAANGAV